MAGYNRVIMIGNLTRDPEHKQLASGQSVCRLGLASNRQFKNRQSGDMVQEVCYVDIDVWGPQADSCRQYLSKGRSILVEGRLKLDSWKDQEGNNRSKHSIVADRIVFLSSQSADAVDGALSTASNSINDSEAGREIMNKIKDVKKRATAAVSKQNTAENQGAGELAFKDEPPFQDDLPF